MSKPVLTFTEIEQQKQDQKDSMEPYLGYLIENLDNPSPTELVYKLFYLEVFNYREHDTQLTDLTWKIKHTKPKHDQAMGTLINTPLLEEMIGDLLETKEHHQNKMTGEKSRVFTSTPDDYETNIPSGADTILIRKLVSGFKGKTADEMSDWCSSHALTNIKMCVGDDINFELIAGTTNTPA